MNIHQSILLSAKIVYSIDVKRTLTPVIRNIKNALFMKKIDNVKKPWIKNVVDKLTKLFKPDECILQTECNCCLSVL